MNRKEALDNVHLTMFERRTIDVVCEASEDLRLVFAR